MAGATPGARGGVRTQQTGAQQQWVHPSAGIGYVGRRRADAVHMGGNPREQPLHALTDNFFRGNFSDIIRLAGNHGTYVI